VLALVGFELETFMVHWYWCVWGGDLLETTFRSLFLTLCHSHSLAFIRKPPHAHEHISPPLV
jgi:hypothetical protein